MESAKGTLIYLYCMIFWHTFKALWLTYFLKTQDLKSVRSMCSNFRRWDQKKLINDFSLSSRYSYLTLKILSAPQLCSALTYTPHTHTHRNSWRRMLVLDGGQCLGLQMDRPVLCLLQKEEHINKEQLTSSIFCSICVHVKMFGSLLLPLSTICLNA